MHGIWFALIHIFHAYSIRQVDIKRKILCKGDKWTTLTSEERHKARDQRRRIKREAKRREKIGKYDNFKNVTDYNNLLKAYRDAKKGIAWKTSVQRYGMDLTANICKIHNKLENEESTIMGFIPFDVMERGKLRHIMSIHFKERVAQKCLSQNVLTPILSNSLIYDNGACRKGMGISHTINRLERHLHEYYRKYGREGYILKIDLKNYFASIPHDKLKEMYMKHITDEKVLRLTFGYVDSFADYKRAHGDKDAAVGLGLGSEINQISAVAYPDPVDHWVKEVKCCRWYARYNDDSYIIHHSKEFLKELLREIREKYLELGIKLNEKKTKIVKLSRGFTFLKTKFSITNTGKVIKRIYRRSITTIRTKLKKFARFLAKGEMSFNDIRASYRSWKGYAAHMNSFRTVRNMDRLFNQLFVNNFILQEV